MMGLPDPICCAVCELKICYGGLGFGVKTVYRMVHGKNKLKTSERLDFLFLAILRRLWFREFFRIY